MNEIFLSIVNKALMTEDITLTEEELLSEGVFFKVSPFTAFSAFKQKAFNSLINSKSFLVSSKVAKSVNPLNAVAGVKIGVEKLKSKLGDKGKEKNDTVYKLQPEQRRAMAEIYNKYGKELVEEIEMFRSNVLAPYQLIKRTIKQNRILSSKEVNGMSKEEYLSARESGRKKIEKRGKIGSDSKASEEQINNVNDALKKAKDLYDSFDSSKGGDFSNDSVEKMLRIYGAGNDNLQGYSLDELKQTYDAIIRNKAMIAKKMKNYEDSETKVDILKLLRDNRILREKGASALAPKAKEDNKEEVEKKKGTFNVAFSNYMLRDEIKKAFKSEMGGEIYKATYRNILKENIKNISDKREEVLSSFIKLQKNIEFTKNEEKVWGKSPINVQKYSGNIKDYYQKIRDEDFKEPIYIEKTKSVIKAENEIENEIKRFERKLAKIVEPEDLTKLKKYRLINNLIVVSEMKNPESLFKTREEIMASSKKGNKERDFMDEEEYLRKVKHYISLKYDTFQELSDAKDEVRAISDSVDEDIANKYKDIVKQFMLKRTLQSEKIVGHKYDNAGEVIDINDVEHLVNTILKKDYKDIDIMKQDKMQLDDMIEKYKKEEPNAEKELGEIKLLLSQIDRKLQGMSITVIGKGKSVAGMGGSDDDDDDEEAELDVNSKDDGKNEPLDKEKK